MAEERDDAQRTEEPTPRRLEEAREQGKVASSRDVASFLLLGLAALLASGFLVGDLGGLRVALARWFALAGQPSPDGTVLARAALETAGPVAAILVPSLGAAAALAIVAGLAQHGAMFTPAAIQPQLSRLSITAGLGRLFSLNAAIELVRCTVKIAAVSVLGFIVIRSALREIVATVEVSPHGILAVTAHVSVRLLAMLAGLAAAAALLDYLWQHHSLMRQLRMTRQEVLDDHKHSEGDPLIKQRLRSLRMARARQRMMADVPKATVVVTNPTHVSVALRYVPGETAAPLVVAKGVDAVAARIRKLAIANGVPLVENAPLARLLHRSVEIGEAIPPAQYQAVAEIIGYVMRMRDRKTR
jgi:flagellar biosynthetic protein FlhB